MIERRETHEVKIGDIKIGGYNDIAIQSMTNVPTKNVDGNINQIRQLVESGCEIVRLEVSNLKDIDNFAEIKNKLRKDKIYITIVADTHFSPNLALKCLAIADKVRINAGNFSDKITKHEKFSETEFREQKERLQEKLMTFFSAASSEDKPIRIGINQGSLSGRIVYKFGNTPLAMWESAKECLDVAESSNFKKIVLSFKSSNTVKMIEANRIACTEMDKNGWRFPIHLGVTESGDGEYARIKSAIGLGTLLTDGIGDTIRVSLTEDPINEIFTAKHILQACCVRRFYPEIISCPSCGRTSYDIQSILGQVKEITKNISQQKFLKIAVMGCIINGLGEANDADIAIVGNYNGTLSIFKNKICVSKNITQDGFSNAFSQVLTNF